MNNAFANGDVFGNHRPACRCSRGASIATLADDNDGSELPAQPDAWACERGEEWQQQAEDQQRRLATISGWAARRQLAATPVSLVAEITTRRCRWLTRHQRRAATAQAPAGAPLGSSTGLAIDMNMANDDMVMALFNAMSNASAAAQQGATTSQPLQQQRQQGAAGFGASLGLDPHALELLQQGAGSSLGPTAEAGEAQAMDWCFDWSNPVAVAAAAEYIVGVHDTWRHPRVGYQHGLDSNKQQRRWYRWRRRYQQQKCRQDQHARSSKHGWSE
ncbi:hypothetical protein DL89DRAFT_181439 [Linderina pennispora]|uniref:Uncharacterized protein n=1 Tax=Linderina pennispora TaxID=61395 RepID=A0A1Y1W561_9FUNG|nr:uncharacterized protein DL89DRAFT_181439 [Linderina pennispora]ORX68661.1 hypothetical protein DL89DRAFT_181439 [Linderina pennispora]